MTITQINISMPKCEKGIGDVILAPDSPKLIEGVKCLPFTLWPDDRGYFLEVQRFGRGLVEGFPKETTQISAALNYPGIIKAFHFHRYQTDCWTPTMNMLQNRAGRYPARIAHVRRAEHDLRRQSQALANSDSAWRGSRL